MSENQVNNLLGVSMEKIKEMVDVNTVIGDPIATPDGTTVIPISRVSYGFASGGTAACACCRSSPMSAPWTGPWRSCRSWWTSWAPCSRRRKSPPLPRRRTSPGRRLPRNKPAPRRIGFPQAVMCR